MLQNGIRKKSILCVEDEKDHTEMLTIWLKLNGYEVHSAADCEGALAIADKQPFEVCIVDFRLPDGSGLDLCRRLKKQLPNTSFILNTCDARPIVQAEAAALGIGIIPKPTDLDLLCEMVGNLVYSQ